MLALWPLSNIVGPAQTSTHHQEKSSCHTQAGAEKQTCPIAKQTIKHYVPTPIVQGLCAHAAKAAAPLSTT
eukprot:1930986-Prorocentrum_lima.AAC.1